MFKFLIGVLIFLIIIGLLARLLRNVISFFGVSSNRNARSNNRQNGSTPKEDVVQKRFSKSEGEYVDYEEIKDDSPK